MLRRWCSSSWKFADQLLRFQSPDYWCSIRCYRKTRMNFLVNRIASRQREGGGSAEGEGIAFLSGTYTCPEIPCRLLLTHYWLGLYQVVASSFREGWEMGFEGAHCTLDKIEVLLVRKKGWYCMGSWQWLPHTQFPMALVTRRSPFLNICPHCPSQENASYRISGFSHQPSGLVLPNIFT